MKRSRGGFLEMPVKERLLRKTNWKKDASNKEISDYFYEIREHAKSALLDLHLLCDTLSESQLKEIFGTEEILFPRKDQFTFSQYPISNLMQAILLHTPSIRKRSESELKERQWRKLFLEEIVIMCLDWYYNSGIFRADHQLNMIYDTMDLIALGSSGFKKVERRDNPPSYVRYKY